jgi:AcrR family transcriptional regulator
MLQRDPVTPLTMARAAEAAEATPMSLYRHFTDKDDLVQAVTRHVMRDAEAAVPAEGSWQDRVAGWMSAVYDRATRHPQLFVLTASGESLAWLPHAAHLATILESAGFADEGLAEAVFWIGSTTLGQAMLGAATAKEMTLPRLYGALGQLADEVDAGRMAKLVPHFAGPAGVRFELIIDLSIAALVSRLA